MEIQIVAGFLGAGKTTFLNKYLPMLPGKTVVIENEFGDIGIDGGLIREDIPVQEIYAGCICCSLALDFRKGIKEIAEKFHPDRILIEPSGVGRLSDIVKACRKAREKEQVGLRITKLITMVDITSFEEYEEGFGAFYRDQIERAGLLLLSNIDGLDSEGKKRVIGRLRELNPKAVLYCGDWRQMEEKPLLELLHVTDDLDERDEGCASVPVLPADRVFSSLSFTGLTEMTEGELELLMKELKKETYGYILRVKGRIKAREGKMYHFDHTPSSSEYREIKETSGLRGEAVIIGCGLNQPALERLFRTK